MDNPELIDNYEAELWQLLTRMHNDGIRYDVVYYLLLEITKSLEIMGHCENWAESVGMEAVKRITM